MRRSVPTEGGRSSSYDLDFSADEMNSLEANPIAVSSWRNRLPPWLINASITDVLTGVGVVIIGGYLLHGSTQPQVIREEATSQAVVDNGAKFDPTPIIEGSQGDLNATQQNLSAFMQQEFKGEIIVLAGEYIAAANSFTSEEGHPCYGMTTIECLMSFNDNRMQDLLASAESSDPLVTMQARAKLEAHRLAIATVRNNQGGQGLYAWEEELLAYYHVAFKDSEGTVDVANVRVRPATLTALYGQVLDQRKKVASIEEQAQVLIEEGQ